MNRRLRDALKEYAKTGKLSELVPLARKKYAYAHPEPYEIQLRLLPDQQPEVVMFIPETPQNMRRGADGVVVVAQGPFEDLLG